MFDDYQICPYTGLRSFTEEESLYFKGRDEHIDEATKLLEKNKFLMLTGASGEGKSSLVYAGIVPNARAGFLKATYTQWCVADFRPERSPFKNLCAAISTQLEVSDVGIVESELSHGFSSLIEFYKNSIRYNDTESNEWLNANEEEKAALKRRAANLIIIADQFEEFFTNPENYRSGKPSKESNLVVNILLETARIALEERLPIYIIFTMRSDYIGQCAAFRGLPESIGFSQFFVPRLNRNELLDVVEEPAVLSGNRISRRLTDRLVHDIVEGIDQLPLLQHTLNQIWVAANDGKDEMDLLHYAMVGGLSVDELPDEDKIIFNKWFNDLPKNIQACYNEPKLQNVLDSHANKLFETANEYYKEKNGETISIEVKNSIIKTAFTCLTKIDQSRAVRNRMTLREIHKIINRPDITLNMVKGVLNLFREPGNTLVRPFITEDVDSSKLTDDDILDITHESLIRNWELLKEWANEEFEHLTTYQDFYQQVSRWKENNKSSGFLLPIGTLIHFEDWAINLNPNPYWINRYLKTGEEEKTLPRAKEILEESNDYLERSSKKHAVSRWVMKVGMGKIAAVLSALVILIATSFGIVEKYHRSNEYIIDNINTELYDIIESLSLNEKSSLLANLNNIDSTSTKKVLERIDTDIEKLHILANTGYQLFNNDNFGQNKLKKDILVETNHLLDSLLALKRINTKELLASIIAQSVFLETYAYFQQESLLEDARKKTGNLLSRAVKESLESTDYKSIEIQEFTKVLELALNFKALSATEIDEIINKISPFSDHPDTVLLKTLFPEEKTLVTGMFQNVNIKYNGLYQLLGFLYATKGDYVFVEKCMEKLYSDLPQYANYRPNDITLIGYFTLYDHWEEMNKYVEYLSKKYKVEEYNIYKMALERVRHISVGRDRALNNDFWANPILVFLPLKTVEKLFEKNLSMLNELPEGSEKHYELASFYKLKGLKYSIFANNYDEDRFSEISQSSYKNFINSYKSISESYLTGTEITFIDDDNLAEVPRKAILNYPDYHQLYYISQVNNFHIRYNNSTFIEFVLNNGYFDMLFQDEESLVAIQNWLETYLRNQFRSFQYIMAPNISALIKLEEVLTTKEDQYNLNLNALRLLIASHYYSEAKYKKMKPFLERCDPSTFDNLYIPLTGPDNTSTFDVITRCYIGSILARDFGVANKIFNGVSQEQNQLRLYSAASYELYYNGEVKLSEQYLDSAKIQKDKIKDYYAGFIDSRRLYIHAYHLNNNSGDNTETLSLLKKFQDTEKAVTKTILMRANAFKGNLYEAISLQGEYPSVSDNQRNYISILSYYNIGINGRDSSLVHLDKNRWWFIEGYGFNLY